MMFQVVIDCDPGLDDAMALLLALRAHKEGLWDLKAITIVQGNTAVDNGCKNALRIMEVTRQKVEIFRGCSSSLVIPFKRPSDETPFHGYDGFGDVGYPEPKDTSLLNQKIHAVDKLIDLSIQYQGKLVVIALGPLTNIAMAMNKDEKFASRLKDIYIMGGNTKETANYTMTSEFNFICDPEAAHVVLQKATHPVYLIGLHLCYYEIFLTREFRRDELGSIESRESAMMNKIEHKLVYSDDMLNDRMKKYNAYLCCDQVAVAVALKPDIITGSRLLYGTVELGGVFSRGALVTDTRLDVGEPLPSNVIIIDTIQTEKFKDMLKWAFGCTKTKI